MTRATWGSNFLNAVANWDSAVENAYQAWAATLNNGGRIWIAEGGQSDFSAAVVRLVKARLSSVNTRTRIHVVQHSNWNQNQADQGDLNYLRAETNYKKIDDGNIENQTADLSERDANFVSRARQSKFGSAWDVAFDYLDPIGSKLDFSDTVELLEIMDIGTNQVADAADFADLFF